LYIEQLVSKIDLDKVATPKYSYFKVAPSKIALESVCFFKPLFLKQNKNSHHLHKTAFDTLKFGFKKSTNTSCTDTTREQIQVVAIHHGYKYKL